MTAVRKRSGASAYGAKVRKRTRHPGLFGFAPKDQGNVIEIGTGKSYVPLARRLRQRRIVRLALFLSCIVLGLLFLAFRYF